MVLNLDFAPTILDLAGVSVPPEMQGRSLARLLRAEGPGVHDSFLYEYLSDSFLPVIPDIQAVRTSARKYVSYPGGGDDELYDLAADPTEMRNLAARPEWAATRTDMREQLQRLLQQTGALQ
jgi:arylsulfatase A-like enzyme